MKSDLATYDGLEAVWSAVQDTGRPLAAAALNAGIGAETAILPSEPGGVASTGDLGRPLIAEVEEWA